MYKDPHGSESFHGSFLDDEDEQLRQTEGPEEVIEISEDDKKRNFFDTKRNNKASYYNLSEV
jgi:hypothetical protein